MPGGHALPYTAFPDVNPAGAPSNDFEQIKTSPDMFGGLIAQGEEKLGAGAEKASTAATDVAVQQQGMLNETLSTNAETSYMTELGNLTAAYKTKEGLEAVSAKPQYDAEVAKLRQTYLQSLPNFGAQRAFNLLALRHEGYALQDSAGYAATQLKKADLYSANSSSAALISGAGSLDVAENDQRFQDHLHGIDFASRRMMQNQGWADYMQEDPKTHELTFADSPQGQQAKAVYDETNGKAIAMAYENRFHVLADQNVVAAYQKYQASRDKIPGQAQVELDAYFTPKIRDAQTRTIAGGVLTDVNNSYQRAQNYKPLVQASADKYGVDPTVLGRQLNQESGYRDVTSSAGARGIAQFISGTAARYGVDVHDPQSSIDGAAHYMSDLLKQFGGNYGLALAGYNWGEKNVAAWMASGANPASMPLETRNYIQSITGQDVATWASGQGKTTVGASDAANVPKLSQADYFRANYESILNETRVRAEAQHPDDPRFVDLSVSKVEQQLNISIRQQDLQHKADGDLVQQAFNGQLSPKQKAPTSVDEMVAISPDVRAAWQRMQIDNPIAAEHIETRILTANGKAGGHDVATYGNGFYDLFRRVHAPEGDPERITDPTQLYKHVGENGDLTISGLEKLTGEITSRRSPEGVAEAEMKSQFLKNARAQITGTDEGLHIKDPKGDELYLRFLAQALPAYDAGRRTGKTAAQLLNPESPDYVGKVIGNFKRPMDQWFSDTIHDNPGTATSAPFDPKSIKTLEQAQSAYRSGNISRAQAAEIAIANGWAYRKPAVPTPPMSQ
jgi:soluble lytic murein transglycosylase-like protein